jgi:hypothetical protein
VTSGAVGDAGGAACDGVDGGGEDGQRGGVACNRARLVVLTARMEALVRLLDMGGGRGQCGEPGQSQRGEMHVEDPGIDLGIDLRMDLGMDGRVERSGWLADACLSLRAVNASSERAMIRWNEGFLRLKS